MDVAWLSTGLPDTPANESRPDDPAALASRDERRGVARGRQRMAEAVLTTHLDASSTDSPASVIPRATSPVSTAASPTSTCG